MSQLTLTILPTDLVVCRLPPGADWPAWATSGPLVSISRTADELSVVCAAADVPDDVPATMRCEPDWRAFKVEGPLDFGLTGVLASLANPLAEAKISIFAISTFDTDYVLVKAVDLDAAAAVLMRFCAVR
ncbi:MAG: ACT domain-containing protein [Acidobacteriota bacterium]